MKTYSGNIFVDVGCTKRSFHIYKRDIFGIFRCVFCRKKPGNWLKTGNFFKG